MMDKRQLHFKLLQYLIKFTTWESITNKSVKKMYENRTLIAAIKVQ